MLTKIFKDSLLFAISCVAIAGCTSYSPKTNTDAHNTIQPVDLVKAHLRAVEKGDWATADAHFADDYRLRMKGMPFFISVKRPDALTMHKARKQAFPDFKFNEMIEMAEQNQVKIAVYLTGTHTGLLDYPKVTNVPKTEATGKKINMPAEYFVYSVENNKLVFTYGEIPEGHGPTALKAQLGIPD